MSLLIFQQPALANREIDNYFTSNIAGTTTNFTNVPYADPCNFAVGNVENCNVPTNTLNPTFGAGNNIRLTGVTVDIAGTATFFEPSTSVGGGTGLADRVVFNRNGTVTNNNGTNPTLVLADRELVFWQYDNLVDPPAAGNGTGSIDLLPDNASTLSEAMLSLIINRGIDNTFNNVSEANQGGAPPSFQETRNNIERIDYIVDAGITVSAADADTTGFTILERGGTDGFGIAAITGLTGGVPSAYGNLIPIGDGPYGTASAANIQTAVQRRDQTTDPLPFRLSHIVPAQDVRGRFFTIGDLTGGAGGTVFGYSLFPQDIDNTFDLTNVASFPTTTTGPDGGIDLIAGGATFVAATSQDFGIFKRITNLTDSTGAPLTTLDFTTEEETTGLAAVVKNAGLDPVGLTNITNVPLSSGDQIEYTIYYVSPTSNSTAVNICDQTPSGTTFVTDTYSAVSGIQFITPGNPIGAPVEHTNANDGDTGRFQAAGLPAFCGTDAGNGAVIEEGLTVNATQAGRVTFRVSVN